MIAKGPKICPAKPKIRKKKTPKAYFKEYSDGRLVIDLDMPQGREMRAKIIAQAWERDHHLCGICQRYVCLLEAVWDHIKPRGMGGGFRDDRLENIQAVHPVWNGLKGSQRDFTLVP